MHGSRNKPDASQPRSGTVVDPRMSLAVWLRTARGERGMSLGDVARVTKIQTRILEKIEGGKLDGLPAEVFVRGFIRSFAKCVGLDEAEALTRYAAASQAQEAAPPSPPSPQARALVDLMAPLALAKPVVEAAPVEIEFAAGSLAIPKAAAVEPAMAEPAVARTQTQSKKKRRGGKRSKRRSMATGTPSTPTPVVVARVSMSIEGPGLAAPVEEIVETTPVVEATPVIETIPVVEATPVAAIEVVDAPVDILDPLVAPPDDNQDIVATEPWQPKMPTTTAAPSVPWRRASYAQTTTAASSVPSLVIDDSDPESAAQLLEDREAAKSVLTNAQRRSFLPPVLLDREDRSARQGGLTLAVIILLIAATLTLSYLMRRPSSSGDGVTVIESRSVETRVVG